MIFLITSIFCSVSVGFLFKILRTKSRINIHLITLNYYCAIIASYFLLEPTFTNVTFDWPIIISLSILLPGIFWILSKAINNNGIIRTDIAQRISLIIPAIFSFWLFKEDFSVIKIIGIIVGLLAIYLILQKSTTTISSTSSIKYLLIVFLGYGFIDTLFKQLSLNATAPYQTSLFLVLIGSGIVSTALSFYTYKKHKIIFDSELIAYGLFLGILNFLNIFFYLKAHQSYSDSPITVFASMNFGVIIIGTLVGSFYFKEKLSTKNIVGLFLALIAISLIVLSQV